MTGYHAAHLTPDPARAVVWQVIAEHLGRWIPSGAHVLEIGAGYCDWINNVKAERRVAVDLWPEVVRCTAAGVEPVVLDVTRDLERLGTQSFDVVLASNVLEHFPPDTVTQVLDGIGRLLRPEGRVLLVQPNFRYAFREYFDDYTHRSVFTDVSLPALLRSRGFEIDRLERRFAPYSMRKARVRPSPWLVRAYLRSPIRPGAGQMLVVARKA